MEKEIRILLVDDHQVVREGLRHMLNQEEDMEVVGQSANAEEALLQLEVVSPNIVLMDIKMPGVDGIELTRRMKEKRPFCNVIMLTLYEEYLAEAMEAGAVGYLLKDAKRTELTQAIKQVYQGDVVISESITAKPRIEYEERFGKKAKDGPMQEHDVHMPEEVQMVILPPVDANQLVGFTNRVEETLQSRMLQMVGSWRGDTAITIALSKPTPFEDILSELGGMSEVETIGEEPLTEEVDPSLFKKVAAMPRLTTRFRKTVFVTLKMAGLEDRLGQEDKKQAIDVESRYSPFAHTQ
ncbi:response regulator transcription factor [Chloroflexota bacterium]